MLNYLKNEANLTTTENGALTYSTTQNECLNLFFRAGAMRNVSKEKIEDVVEKAFIEDKSKTMKIIFYARDVRGGLGERRFFKTALQTLANIDTERVNNNIKYISEYGRWDDILVLFNTPCEETVLSLIKEQWNKDIVNMSSGLEVSLLAKWLPSINASAYETKKNAKKIINYLNCSDKQYRQTLSALRKYIDIIENKLREREYDFDYSKQSSGAMFKYRNAFVRNDNDRYTKYLENVNKGKTTINTNTLYPYEIVRRCREDVNNDVLSLDTTWKNLPSFKNDENAIAVVDGSGSMTLSYTNNVAPIDVALSLGIYFAEHNTGKFANHFITFSHTPQLVEIKGDNIVEKVKYCRKYNEVSDTNLEATFDLILNTAIKYNLSQSEMPKRMYIISDMEFNSCVEGGNDKTLFNTMQDRYKENGYELPEVVFWNVNSRNSNFPVSISNTNVALVSGCTPALFNMVGNGEINPVKIMNDIINSERYSCIN